VLCHRGHDKGINVNVGMCIYVSIHVHLICENEFGCVCVCVCVLLHVCVCVRVYTSENTEIADIVDARQGSQRETCLHIPLWDTAGNILILHDDFKIELSVVCVIHS